MIYIDGIQGRSGGKATKDYEASSIGAAPRLVDTGLRDYPQVAIIAIRLRPNQDIPANSEQ
jgi:hypothetical protein